jgi:hypothetical protein
MIRRTWRTVRVVALAVLAVQAVYYSVAEWREHAALRRIVAERVGPVAGPEEALERTTAVAFDIPPHHGRDIDYELVNPLAALLRPSAYQVYRRGGHCAKRSRLLVELLEVQGIEAHKLYLYNPLGLRLLSDPPRAWVHVVVEARIGDRWVVADPLFGLVFRDAGGRLATAADLAADTTQLRRERLRADERFDVWEDRLYRYDDVRRLPWFTLAGAGEPVRAALVRVFGRATVDGWHEPVLLERPQLQIALLSLALLGAVGLTFVPRRPRPRRGRRARN